LQIAARGGRSACSELVGGRLHHREGIYQHAARATTASRRFNSLVLVIVFVIVLGDVRPTLPMRRSQIDRRYGTMGDTGLRDGNGTLRHATALAIVASG
jgi:hypothetical protein